MFRMGGISVALAVLPSCALADFLKVPIAPKKAYGRVQTKPFQIQSTTLKRLGWVEAKNDKGIITGRARTYALSLLSSDQTGIVLYFTSESSIQNKRLQRSKSLPGTVHYRKELYPDRAKVPIGITSAQLLYFNSKTGLVESKVYRGRFSAKIALGYSNGNTIPVQVFAVLPDLHQSFIYGAAKANLVGF